MPTEAERQSLAELLQPPPLIPGQEKQGSSQVESVLRNGDASAEIRARPMPRPRRAIALWLLVGLLFLVVGSGAAFIVWDQVTSAPRNSGAGDEDALAYLPADSTVFLQIDMEEWARHLMTSSQIEPQIRALGTSELFTDCKRATGLEPLQLFQQVSIAV
jgi:hypothetical protein